MAVTPCRMLPSMRTSMVFGWRCSKHWVCQYMLHFTGTDTEGQSPKSAMGSSMAVAAYNRHSRLGVTQLRSNDVYDPLVRAMSAHTAECRTPGSYSLSSCICFRLISSANASLPSLVPSCGSGRNAVVYSCDSFIRSANFQTTAA